MNEVPDAPDPLDSPAAVVILRGEFADLKGLGFCGLRSQLLARSRWVENQRDEKESRPPIKRGRIH